MVRTTEIAIIIILIIIIGGLITLNVQNYFKVKKARSFSLYRSFNIPKGHSVTLNAPSGYTLSIDKIFVGTGPLPHSEPDVAKSCYAAMQDLDAKCKNPTQVYWKGTENKISTIIPNKVEGKTIINISSDDVDRTIQNAARDSVCIPSTSCTIYVFGIYECLTL